MDAMGEKRLGDVIDDHCIKCRRVTNHSIVSLLDGEAAKVRCRTCYHDHDYRHEQAPPTKKELKKIEADALAAAEAASGKQGDGSENGAGPSSIDVGLHLDEGEDGIPLDAFEIDTTAEEAPPVTARKTRRA